MDQEQLLRAIELAGRNADGGRLFEPRIFTERLTLSNTTGVPTHGTPEVFRNGESYPIRITSMLIGATAPSADERIVQAAGLQLSFHDQFYMRRAYVPAPVWSNRPVAAGPALSIGQSTWCFNTPFILSARDAMRVRVGLRTAPTSSKRVTVSFTGVGMDTSRPYFKSATRALSATTVVPLPPDELRNDGTEPVLVTQMSVHADADLQSGNPTGDVRDVVLDVAQLGNGTQADWVSAPGSELASALLLGHKTGRALVHDFPGSLLWEPGEGLQLSMAPLDPSAHGAEIGVALLGTIEVM